MMTRNGRGLLAGVAAAAVMLALAELGASLVPGAVSPVLAVARTVISSAPARVREVLVSSAGTADKPALLIGIVLVVLLLGGLLGALVRSAEQRDLLAVQRRRGLD